MKPLLRLAAVAVTVAALAPLTGCSKDAPAPKPSTSASTSASASTPAGDAGLPGTDQSKAVMDGATWVEPVASVTRPGTTNNPAHTVSILSVTATADSTILRWTETITPTPEQNTTFVARRDGRAWQEMPLLTDATTQRGYRVSTFVLPDGSKSTWCMCVGFAATDKTQRPFAAYYPALPDSVKSVTIAWPGIEGVMTVPVTR